MTPEELASAYNIAARPFKEGAGPIHPEYLSIKSWRYLIEISSACNLKCAMCISGNRGGYAYTPGIMKMDMLERVLDKIVSENPKSILCPYGSSEPFLNPNFYKAVLAIKQRGLVCEVATNLHYVDHLEDILDAQPDMLIVSVSGFTQEVYERAHRGGNIETVKNNLKILAAAREKHNSKTLMIVSYHKYKYNLHEVEFMKAFAEKLGFMFLVSCARVISMENTVQSLRFLEEISTGKNPPTYDIGKGGLDWNKLMPPAKQEYIQGMEQLLFHPKHAKSLYSFWPVSPVCIIADIFTYIRWDGRVQLCAWTDDMRMTLGNYLEMSQDQISEARRGFPFCKECLRCRMNLYYHCVEGHRWETYQEPK
jgi:MoaA/NifB/PqqE/SkfB family radical SAM enzyme